MIAANTIPARELSTARVFPARRRVRSVVPGYVASLQAQLAITKGQLRAWAAFAATLSANSRRMHRVDDEDQPFGPLLPPLLLAASSPTHLTVFE
jgi:hypothetical protein